MIKRKYSRSGRGWIVSGLGSIIKIIFALLKRFVTIDTGNRLSKKK